MESRVSLFLSGRCHRFLDWHLIIFFGTFRHIAAPRKMSKWHSHRACFERRRINGITEERIAKIDYNRRRVYIEYVNSDTSHPSQRKSSRAFFHFVHRVMEQKTDHSSIRSLLSRRRRLLDVRLLKKAKNHTRMLGDLSPLTPVSDMIVVPAFSWLEKRNALTWLGLGNYCARLGVLFGWMAAASPRGV